MLSLATGSGQLRFAPGVDANLTPLIHAIGERMTALYGKPLILTSARRAGAITASGNVSDHASGNALDIGIAANGGTTDGPVGDRIAGNRAHRRRLDRTPCTGPKRATGASSACASSPRPRD